MDEIEEVKQRYEQFKSNAFAYPSFYKAWGDIATLLSRLKESDDFVTAWRESCEEAEERIKELERQLHAADEGSRRRRMR